MDVNIIDSREFAEEHPFLHLVSRTLGMCNVLISHIYQIHSTSNLLSTSQIKSEIVDLLARKRSLVLQLVELETRYDSLRSLLCEDEGNDETNAFCQSNYGVDNLLGANGELAFALMDLTFKPYTFPGLDVTER